MGEVGKDANWPRDNKRACMSLPTTVKDQQDIALQQLNMAPSSSFLYEDNQPCQGSDVNTTEDSAEFAASEHTSLLSPGVESTWERYTSCRWTLAYLLGVMSMLVHCQRSCLSMALVCMNPAHSSTNSTELHNTSSESNTSHTTAYISAENEGFVLAAYFYGYLVTPFFTGIIMGGLNVGPKRLLSVSMATSAILTLLTPLAIRWNVGVTVALRVALGLAGGTMVPCTTATLGWWSPEKEMAKLMALALSGSSTGYLLANVASGFMCSIPVYEGWPFIFFTTGLMLIVWVVTWEFTGFDTPELHPRIANKETSLIQQQRRITSASASNKKQSLPWRSIWTSFPFLSLCVANVSYKWLQCVVTLYTPFFLNRQLHFLVSTFLCRVLFQAGFSMLTDHLQATSLISVSANRKLFLTTGLTVPGGLLLGAGYIGVTSPGVSVVMVVMSACFHAAGFVSYSLNPLDLSPRHAGTLAGITQTCGSTVQFICPLVFSAVVTDDLPSSWASAFNITGIVALLGAVVFIAFGSGKQQPWAE